jgi:hypothetical protein
MRLPRLDYLHLPSRNPTSFGNLTSPASLCNTTRPADKPASNGLHDLQWAAKVQTPKDPSCRLATGSRNSNEHNPVPTAFGHPRHQTGPTEKRLSPLRLSVRPRPFFKHPSRKEMSSERPGAFHLLAADFRRSAPLSFEAPEGTPQRRAECLLLPPLGAALTG